MDQEPVEGTPGADGQAPGADPMVELQRAAVDVLAALQGLAGAVERVLRDPELRAAAAQSAATIGRTVLDALAAAAGPSPSSAEGGADHRGDGIEHIEVS